MRTDRRSFIRLAGLGVAGAALMTPFTAWAERIRILGGDERLGDHFVPATQASPELREFLAGIRMGEIGTHGSLSVVWLHGATPPFPLAIATLEEARSRGDLVISERDQANVPELIVENRGKSHVLLLAGEILLGGKQNRVLTEDTLLPPGSGPRTIGVYCVEQGRWSGDRKHFDSRGSFAAPRMRAKVMGHAGQAMIWAEVDQYARRAEADSPTQSYQEIYEKPEVREHLADVERRFDHRTAASALGAAVFVGETLAGLDLFVEADLFAKEWPKLLRAQALEAYRQSLPPEPDTGKLRSRVETLLRAAAGALGAFRTNAGDGRLFEFRLESQRGSALIHFGRIIHAAIL